MRPVEIEFLVKDSTKAGAQRVSSSIDRETIKILGQIDRIQAKIDKLKSTNVDALDQDKSIAEIKKLEGEIDRLQTKMAKLSAKSSIGPSASEIESATRQYNGLNNSIQQIARELPAAAMGPQMFFMAISNNLPIFTDELARARNEYERLIASGQKGVPVWKQILSSIVSWQTALAVGIMLLITYGDEIGQWVTSLFKGKEAMDANAVAAERFHATMVDGARNAQTEVVKLNLLYKAATDNAKSMDERREAADRLKESYPEYFSKLTTEQILLGQANEQYKTLVKNIYDYAKAQAAFKNLVAVAEKEQTLQGASSYEKYLKIYEKLKEARSVEADAQKQYDETPWTQRGNASEVYRSLTDAQAWRRSYQREADDAAKVLIEELSKIPGGSDVVEMINEQFDGEIGALIDALQAQRQSLEDVATSAQITDDPTKPSKQMKLPKPEADKQSRDLLLQATRDMEDAQNDIIEDGYEKRRAIAKTAFERQLHDIRENREKLLAEDKKETGGANKMQINTIFDAQVMAVATQYRQTLSQIDKEQQADATKVYDDLLKKYETYLQGRERLARQYEKDIAALSASPENQEVAEQAKDKALAEFDVAFASQFPQFEQWATTIVTKSIEKLRELIALAEFELEAMEADANADPDAVAKTRASIAVMRQTLANAKSQSKEGGEDSFKEWEQLSEVLGRVQDDLKEIGEAFGDTVGEVIDAAGSIASSTISIISGIQTLTEASVKGVETTSAAASTAISSVEKASVILTVISAVFSIIQTLAKVFKDVETEQERNIRLAREFNEELRIMNERARIDRSDDSIFGDAVYENFRQNIDVMRQALKDLEEDKRALTWYRVDPRTNQPVRWENEADSLANMQVQVKKRGRDKYASLGDLVPELFGDDGQINMDALAEFANESNETFNKLSEENKQLIRSMVADWETYEQALESVKDYLNSIFGELGETILDSMISVADGTMTAADAMTTRLEALSGTVKQFAKNMIYAMTIGPILEEAEKKILDIQAGTGTEEEKYDAMLAVLSGVLTDVEAEQDVVNQLYNRFRDMAAAQGIDIDQQQGATQSGKAGAMYTVSQDSFTRAEGILTSIQAHVASGELKMDNITAQLIQQLDVLNAIVSNTAPIAEIYTLLITMQREGIRVV